MQNLDDDEDAATFTAIGEGFPRGLPEEVLVPDTWYELLDLARLFSCVHAEWTVLVSHDGATWHANQISTVRRMAVISQVLAKASRLEWRRRR